MAAQGAVERRVEHEPSSYLKTIQTLAKLGNYDSDSNRDDLQEVGHVCILLGGLCLSVPGWSGRASGQYKGTLIL